MNIVDAIGLQKAFNRFITQVMGLFGSSKPKNKDILNLLESIPPPKEWVA